MRVYKHYQFQVILKPAPLDVQDLYLDSLRAFGVAPREADKQILISPDVAEYLARITAATRQHADLRLGASPRGTLALARGARGLAFLRGREYVTPDMVKYMAGPVQEHRLIVRPQAAALGKTATLILKAVPGQVPPPA